MTNFVTNFLKTGLINRENTLLNIGKKIPPKIAVNVDFSGVSGVARKRLELFSKPVKRLILLGF